MHTTASMQRDAIARQDTDAMAGQDDGTRQHDAGALPAARPQLPASSGHNPPLGSLYQVNGRRLMLHQSGPRAAAHQSGPRTAAHGSGLGGVAVPAGVIAAGASAGGLDY